MTAIYTAKVSRARRARIVFDAATGKYWISAEKHRTESGPLWACDPDGWAVIACRSARTRADARQGLRDMIDTLKTGGAHA